jgi:hypothetical protein
VEADWMMCVTGTRARRRAGVVEVVGGERKRGANSIMVGMVRCWEMPCELGQGW